MNPKLLGSLLVGIIVVTGVYIGSLSLNQNSLTQEVFENQQAQVSSALTNGLISHWKFDEGSGSTVSASVGGGSDTLGSPSWTTGKIGSALTFNGSDYVNAGSISTPKITISAWIKPTNNPDYASVVMKQFTYGIETRGGNIYAGIGNGSEWANGSTGGGYLVGSLSVGSWQLVTQTYDGTTNRLYINGKLVSSGTAALSTSSSAPLLIGSWDTSLSEYFKGDIDDVRVYNRALSASEVKDLYAYTGIVADTTGPVISNLQVSEIQKNQVTITWDTNEASDTHVEFGLTSSYTNTSTLKDTGAGMVTSHRQIIVGLQENTVYNYRVTSKDASGNATRSSNSTFTTVSTVDTTKPSTPTNISSSNITQTGLRLSWSASTDNVGVTGYKVYRNGVMASSPVSTNSFVDSNLNSETTYTYSVVAFDAAGNDSAQSSNLLVKTLTAPSVTISTRINGVVLQNPANCVSTLATPTGNNTGSCSRTITNQTAGTYETRWVGGYPAGADITKTPVITPSQVLSSNNITFYIDFAAVAPTVTFSTSVTSVVTGQLATLSWSSTNASSCTATGGTFAGQKAISGSQLITPTVTTTYGLSCTGTGGTVSATPITITFTASPTSDLLSYWNFDQTSGSTVADSSGNNKTATIVGNPTWTTGVSGNSLQFNGTNAYLNAGSVSVSKFTISAWVNMSSGQSGWGSIVMKQNSFGLEVQNGRVYANVGNGSKWNKTISTPLTAGTWKHVVQTYDGTTNKLYIDGVLISSGNGAFTNTSSNLLIGSWNGSSEYFNGMIDEVRIYNSALTATGVQALYKTVVPPSNIFNVSRSMIGTGSGTITCNPVSCSNTTGSSVSLTAAPASGSVFAGWSGACTGTGACSLTSAGTVTATFNLVPVTTPNSTKFISSDRVAATDIINIRSSPSASATLLGSQALGALGTITTNSSNGVSADGYYWWNINYDTGVDGWSVENYLVKYTPPTQTTFTVTTAKAGTGSGTVTCNPSTCTANTGGTVSVTATPASGSVFAGFSGACSGTSCSLTSAGTVTATFNLVPVTGGTTFYVSPSGSGAKNGASPDNAYAGIPASLVAGATYHVAPGSYPKLTVTSSGTAAAPITIRRSLELAPNELVASADMVTFASGSVISGSNVIVDGKGWHGFNFSSGATVAMNGGAVTVLLSGSNVTLKNGFFNGNYGSGYASLGVIPPATGVTTVSYSDFYQSSYEDQLNISASVGGGDVVFDHNVFRDNNKPNRSDTSHRDVSNPWTGTGGWGLTLSNNIFFNTPGHASDQPQGDEFLLQIGYGGSATPLKKVIAFNNVVHNTARFIAFGSQNSGVNEFKVYNNTLRNTTYASSLGITTTAPAIAPTTANNISGSVSGGFVNSNPTSIQAMYGADGRPFTSDDAFALTSASTVIDKGTGSLISPVDITGRTRTGTADFGAYEYSGTVQPPVNNPPTVTLISSPSSAVTPGTFSLSASASDSDGTVARVEFYNGATLLSTDTTSPYAASFTQSTVGTYTLTARAYDNVGAMTTSNSVSASVTAAPVPSSTKFISGDKVATTDILYVRNAGSTGATSLGTQALGSLGTVIGGGTSSDGYYWWNINYDTGVDGWSVENYLVKYTAPTTPTGTTFYIRQGATGNGSDWNNAYGSIPATLVRGATYYVADGSYGSYEFNDAIGNGAYITVKKATVASHGTDIGWVNTYGDGQAVFGGLGFVTDNYIIDGVTRNESNWRDTASYGFRATGQLTWNTSWYPTVGNNITIKYIDVGATPSESFSESHPDNGVYFGGFAQLVRNVTVSRAHIHNVDLPVQMAGVDGFTIEYTHMGPGWQKEIIRGQNTARNVIIRHNVMLNACQTVPGDSSDGRVACTAPIAIWPNSDTPDGAFDNNQIYGNVIATTLGSSPTDGLIFVGSTLTGQKANGHNTKVYNNTIVGYRGNATRISLVGNNTSAYNNMAYDTTTFSAGATIAANNRIVTTNPFISSTYKLNGPQSGTALASPYNTDLTGAVRGADGVWDIGAYEYTGTGTTPPVSTACTQTLSTGANIASAVSGAAAGSIICLNSGNYGTVNFTDIAKTGRVTIKSASGVGAQMSPNFSNSDYIRLESMTLSNASISRCSTNIQIVGNTWVQDTGGISVNDNGFGCDSSNKNILIDGNTMIMTRATGGEGKITLTSVNGVTITKNLIQGQPGANLPSGSKTGGDGIQTAGSVNNIIIGPGNIFRDILQAPCGSDPVRDPHCDSIQIVDSVSNANIIVNGNWFDNVEVTLQHHDWGTAPVKFTNNLVTNSRHNWSYGSPANNYLIEHNTFYNQDDPNWGAYSVNSTGMNFRNNIVINSENPKLCPGCSASYNLGGTTGQAIGTSAIVGTPTFVGGSLPTTWAGWQLATGSLGKGTASDGLDRGTNYFGPTP